MKNNKGYSMIEIGIGLLIIVVFSIFSIALFNGCYNNHNVIKRTNLALSYAIRDMENALSSDFSSLGFTNSMLTKNGILSASSSASPSDRATGYYAVPIDPTEEEIYSLEKYKKDKDIVAYTIYRRIPANSGSEAYDNTVIKVIVTVKYKIRANDANWREIKIESVKLTK